MSEQWTAPHMLMQQPTAIRTWFGQFRLHKMLVDIISITIFIHVLRSVTSCGIQLASRRYPCEYNGFNSNFLKISIPCLIERSPSALLEGSIWPIILPHPTRAAPSVFFSPFFSASLNASSQDRGPSSHCPTRSELNSRGSTCVIARSRRQVAPAFLYPCLSMGRPFPAHRAGNAPRPTRPNAGRQKYSNPDCSHVLNGLLKVLYSVLSVSFHM